MSKYEGVMETENTRQVVQKRARTFTPEFKAQTARLVIEEARSKASVARDLGLAESVVGRWVNQAVTDKGPGGMGPLTTAERTELASLRKENRVLKMERDILKKATAFFAKENK